MTMLEALGMLWVALLAKLWQLLRAQQLLSAIRYTGGKNAVLLHALH